jgi:hypothetical protein
MRWARHVALTGDRRVTFMAVVNKQEGKRPRRNWGDTIKMDLPEVGWDGLDWMDLIRIGIGGGLL